MVYVNSFNAFIGVGLILLISFFIIYVAYLWVHNLEEKAEISISGELSSHVCNCLSIISDNGKELVLMNVNCLYVENLIVRAGNEFLTVNQTLYYEDFEVIDYIIKPPYYSVNYNNCNETLI